MYSNFEIVFHEEYILYNNFKVNFELYALIVRLKNYEGRSIFFLLQTNREVTVDLTNKHSISKANQVFLHHLLWQ